MLALNKRNHEKQAAARKYGKWSTIVLIISIVITVIVALFVTERRPSGFLKLLNFVEKLNGTAIDFHARATGSI